MTKDLFIIVLAVLTAVSGVAMVIMFLRRRREQREEQQRADEAVEGDPDGRERDRTARRPIDDYAIPIELDGASDDEADIGKICPSCGKRYRSHHRFCDRDNSELAALN